MAALVACATLAGGVAAGIQIYDYLTKPKEEAGWKRLVVGDARVLVPDTWDVLDMETVLRRASEVTGEEPPHPEGDPPTWYFGQVGDLPKDGKVPSGSLSVYDVQIDFDKLTSLVASDPDYEDSKLVDLPEGDSLRVVYTRGVPGSQFHIEHWYIQRPSKLWLLSLKVPAANSPFTTGMFQKIAQEIDLP